MPWQAGSSAFLRLCRPIFEKWKSADTAGLLSNLQKNEELKSVLLRETPWVLEAQTETQQKKNLALLFDMMKMTRLPKSVLDKLQICNPNPADFPGSKVAVMTAILHNILFPVSAG